MSAYEMLMTILTKDLLLVAVVSAVVAIIEYIKK